MTTYDLTQWTSAHPHSQFTSLARCDVRQAVFDATKQNLAQNDIAQLIDVPANTFVLGVVAEVATVEGAACLFDIGDGATANGFLDDFDANAASNAFGFNATTTPAFGVGKYYATADTIDLKAMSAGGADACIVKVTALMFRLTCDQPA